jgi:hypothetical protein
MNNESDGGSAFPESTRWMLLRDWFATYALVGLVAKSPGSDSWLANQAYKLADAMLEERRVMPLRRKQQENQE